ncbi:hypothetical protein PV10_05717 [Exophiala mesophila]|uniref:FAD/NAD(P)-binding domain-containing protein n=1 Tax=Exophiala mesophila TaxID=212818 RepID=A0A0D1XSM4_EXOME|nr:uncharacterized protein PV10_05717 [Exophiala mesophila]KIV91141.1 hypothetical protein PV10_05717 [Exophiala mesophila]
MAGIGSSLKNVVVVGGSYVGRAAAQELARVIPSTHRVLLIEPHSHFHHLFTFPRFAILPGHEHKAFVPYTGIFSSVPNPAQHAVVHARVVSVQARQVILDRQWQGSTTIPFEYLAIATGTKLSQPAAMKEDDKASSVTYLRSHQNAIKKAKSILIVGGGAVGVQMATDLKEIYPEKQVTVVQSRAHVMPQFHEKLHSRVKQRFDQLGVKLITGARVVLPAGGFPSLGEPFEVKLTTGETLTTEFVVLATGQKPNNDLVADLESAAPGTIINPQNGYIRVRPTLQFANKDFPRLFAVGDIADTGSHKAARPGVGQAAVLAKNVQALLEGREPEETFVVSPPAIHLSLGITENVVFRNPNKAEGQTEPVIIERTDGQADMNVEGFWQRLGVEITNPQQYHL